MCNLVGRSLARRVFCVWFFSYPARDHTAKIRALAKRMSQFATEGTGAFSQQDVDFLTDVGDALVRDAMGLLNDPDLNPEAKSDAQLRLGLGDGLRGARDAVRKHAQVEDH